MIIKRKVRRSSESGSKYSFGAMDIPSNMRPKSGRPLLISPYGPPKPWTVKSSRKVKFGKMTPSGYLATWNGQPIVAPPSWNPLLLQDGSTFKMKTDHPKLSSISFGKKKVSKKVKKVKKPSKTLRKTAKKLGIKITVKRGGKRVMKSEKVLKKQVESALKRKLKKAKLVAKKRVDAERKKSAKKKRTRVIKGYRKSLPYLDSLKTRVAIRKALKKPAYTGPTRSVRTKAKSAFGDRSFFF